MKIIATSFLVLMFATANVMAASSPKIAYVSVEKILTEAPQVKAVNDSMMERFGGRKWPGEVLRLAMLMTHYREPIDFSVRRLEEAENILTRWRSFR